VGCTSSQPIFIARAVVGLGGGFLRRQECRWQCEDDQTYCNDEDRGADAEKPILEAFDLLHFGGTGGFVIDRIAKKKKKKVMPG
jgi:hypothetical protein